MRWSASSTPRSTSSSTRRSSTRLLQEFKTDYNQTHFVRNPEFKAAADKMDGPLRQIFVEFLERSCTAEFSGFLLYKELGRRLKKTNPVVAEIFSLMSRDEARHAGFLNKGLSDFNLALDLGFLTKARKYTFFKPKFIFYATYLSEKIGYWRYITIFRHLKNPEFKRKLDKMVEINQKIIAIGESGDIPLVKNLKRIPLVAALVSEIIAAYLMPPIESGSVDFAEFEPQLVY
ncbi:hypothetical protein PVAP13_5NG192081 [Panicum virgatum]|uniref:magnesium-protoporphyrin IX monomethyl ester (oxidative) cyclase n=1 Tax=Panicum virgatum TaxID=38727 RepID=A0A8T0RUG1_PANVG|nr:hypothetical protein PVAP13_5NG192081 [Panicum virgatum]